MEVTPIYTEDDLNHAETAGFRTVGEIPEIFDLVQSDNELEYFGELLACAEEDYRYIFILTHEGEVLRAFGSYGLSLEKSVWEIPVP